MSIEKVGDFLSGSNHSKSLMRVFLAYKLEKYIYDEIGEKVKVVLRGDTYTVICANGAQAQYLKLKLRQIKQELGDGSKVVIKASF